MQETNSKKKIILTGATGVIGAAIIRECKNLGWDVCAIVRPDSPKNKYIKEYGANLICCDLQKIESVADNVLCQNADYFIHLGWAGTNRKEREKEKVQKRNIEYTRKACEVAYKLGCSVFMFAGSQAEYGRLEGGLTPDLPTNPISEYGKAKLCAGKETQELCKQYGIRHIYTRILSVYGPCNDNDTMIMSTIICLLQGKSPLLTKGEQLWDYMYSDDAAKAMLLLAESGKSGQIYCIGSGKAVPLIDYINIIGRLVNPEIPLGIGEIPYGDNQIMELYADISALKADTGFIPSVSFEEGIRRTKDWIIKNGVYQIK